MLKPLYNQLILLMFLSLLNSCMGGGTSGPAGGSGGGVPGLGTGPSAPSSTGGGTSGESGAPNSAGGAIALLGGGNQAGDKDGVMPSACGGGSNCPGNNAGAYVLNPLTQIEFANRIRNNLPIENFRVGLSIIPTSFEDFNSCNNPDNDPTIDKEEPNNSTVITASLPRFYSNKLWVQIYLNNIMTTVCYRFKVDVYYCDSTQAIFLKGSKAVFSPDLPTWYNPEKIGNDVDLGDIVMSAGDPAECQEMGVRAEQQRVVIEENHQRYEAEHPNVCFRERNIRNDNPRYCSRYDCPETDEEYLSAITAVQNDELRDDRITERIVDWILAKLEQYITDYSATLNKVRLTEQEHSDALALKNQINTLLRLIHPIVEDPCERWSPGINVPQWEQMRDYEANTNSLLERSLPPTQRNLPDVNPRDLPGSNLPNTKINGPISPINVNFNR